MVELPDGSGRVRGAGALSSQVSDAEAAVLRSLMPAYSCDVRTFMDIPFAKAPVRSNRH